MSRRSMALVFVFMLAAAEASAQSFEYFGELGPAHWGSLSPAWAACSTGREQSPVALTGPVASPRYRRLNVEYGETHGLIFNNGHTVEVETEGHNALVFDGEYFELIQFHFHTPSEHREGARSYEMELHLVHRSHSGRLAVIGVFLERGANSGSLAPIFDALPPDIGVRHELPGAFNPKHFLPSVLAHHRYAGSLTTPPCSEGVNWFVLENPVTVSDEHMARFAQLVPFNARPVQRRIR